MSDELNNTDNEILDEDLDLIPQYIKLSLNEDQNSDLLNQIKIIKDEITDLLSASQTKDFSNKINEFIKLKILSDFTQESDEQSQKRKEKVIKLGEEISITSIENLSLFRAPSEENQELTKNKELFKKEVLSLVRKIKALDWKMENGDLNTFEVKNLNVERNSLERKLVREGGPEALIHLESKRKINFIGVFDFIQDLLLDQRDMLDKDNPLSKDFFLEKEHLKGTNSKESQYKEDLVYLLYDMSPGAGAAVTEKKIENENDFLKRTKETQLFSSSKDTSYAQSTFDALMYFRDFRTNYHLYTEDVSLDILRRALNRFDAAFARNALKCAYNLNIVAMYLTVFFQYLVILRNKLKFEIIEINNFDYSENVSTKKKEYLQLQENIKSIVTRMNHRLDEVSVLLSYKESIRNHMKKVSPSLKKDPATLLSILAIVPHVFNKTIRRSKKNINAKKTNIELMICDAGFDFQYRIANSVQEKNNQQPKTGRKTQLYPIYNNKAVRETAHNALLLYASKAKKSKAIEEIEYCIKHSVQIIEKCRELTETNVFNKKGKIKEIGNGIVGLIKKLEKMIQKDKNANEKESRSLMFNAQTTLNLWYEENGLIDKTNGKKSVIE